MTEVEVVNTIRCLAMDVIAKANSGHPGAPMGMAPISTLLWGENMSFDPKDPTWFNRDRFVLSNGHASALQYSMLHLAGYDTTMDDLKNFRQLKSKTPGHPERGVTAGVEVTTGPLGQGVSNAVGLALAEAQLAATYNKGDLKVVDHFTYCFLGDGCLMEGVGQEALSLGGHLGLEKLIFIYDDNKISIDGSTDIAFTEKPKEKYEALGFRVIVVSDGDEDYTAMRAALAEARKPVGKPTMIVLRTTIGRGAKLQGTAKVHGAPISQDEIASIKTSLGRNPDEKFVVGEDVRKYFAAAAEKGQVANAAWKTTVEKYKAQFPAEAAQFEAAQKALIPEGLTADLPLNKDAIATRKASENALAAIMSKIPYVVGGSADLTGSNLTRPGSVAITDFQKDTPAGRYIRFGVREHAMCGVLNGIDAHGGLIGFGATFLNFVSYAMGSVRLAAMSHHGVVYVATHDSIGLGEDGPTHQPVETLAALRALPNLQVMRPADQTETSAAWLVGMESRNAPTCLCLSRQAVPPLAGSSIEGVRKGGYTVVAAAGTPKVVIVSSGTEVSLVVEAAKTVEGAAVVSMPCQELFNQQSDEYKNTVFPAGVPVLSVEPYASFGWEKYSHAHLGLETFGESAPAPKIYEHFGLTASNIASKATALATKFPNGSAPFRGLVQL